MRLTLHIDGGSRGNPGVAGAGVVIRTDEGKLVHEGAYYLGEQTNNGAEYHALIRGLQRLNNLSPETTAIYSDSELLVKQMTGSYRVKNAQLAVLHEQAQVLLLRTGRWQMRHIPRSQNSRADALANMAMDAGADIVVFDIDGAAALPVSPKPISAKLPEGAAPTSATSSTCEVADDVRAVRVTVQTAPVASICPAGKCEFDALTITTQTPAGLCVHAAHALLPTILAIQNTAPDEFLAVPTLTVRCSKRECMACFAVTPQRSTNGQSNRKNE